MQANIKQTPKNILVFPCGTELGLELYKALSFTPHFKIFGANSTQSHGSFLYKNYFELPFVEEENFYQELEALVQKHEIDFLYPAHDSVLEFLSKTPLSHKLVTSCSKTCEITRSKSKTYTLFEGVLPVPKVFSKETVSAYPLFLKPDIGQGARGTVRVDTKEALYFYLRDDHLILEYLPGQEYTIDCFTNFKGELIFHGARERLRVQNGMSVCAEKREHAQFKFFAEKINETLELNGPWFFQVKKNAGGEFVLLEVAPRISGGCSYFRQKGVNLPLMGLYNALSMEVSALENAYSLQMDRALESRFKIDFEYKHVYMDLDETLILNGCAQPLLMNFLYLCIEKGILVYLITRHKKNIKETLDKAFINKDIFSKIVKVQAEKKSEHIYHQDAIFVDDSYREREEVFLTKRIPVFSIDMIPGLIASLQLKEPIKEGDRDNPALAFQAIK